MYFAFFRKEIRKEGKMRHLKYPRMLMVAFLLTTTMLLLGLGLVGLVGANRKYMA
jgi:hypothetical protein